MFSQHAHLQWSQGDFLTKPVPLKKKWKLNSQNSQQSTSLCKRFFFCFIKQLPYRECHCAVDLFMHCSTCQQVIVYLMSKLYSEVSNELESIHRNCFFLTALALFFCLYHKMVSRCLKLSVKLKVFCVLLYGYTM